MKIVSFDLNSIGDIKVLNLGFYLLTIKSSRHDLIDKITPYPWFLNK